MPRPWGRRDEPPTGSHAQRISRRRWLRGWSAAGAAVLAGGLGIAYSYAIEPRWLALERVQVPLLGLPPTFDGLRVAQLSDLHRCPLTGMPEIARAIALAMTLAADVIVLTGDFVSERAAYAAELVPALARLRAPLGVYAVLGNHDHWTDAGTVVTCLRDAGTRVLRNEAIELVRGEQALWLAGVDDVWERQADLPRTLANVPEGAPVVLLAHEPDFADTAAEHAILLQLSGHSHGGQVRPPGLGAPVLPHLAQKYPFGLNRAGNTWVYTNRGVGTTPLGMRFNCRPEVTLLTLVSG